MPSNYIEQSRELYDNYSFEYEQHYFDENTGGFVLIHRNHNTTPSEVFVAEVFAEQGKRVKLLSEQFWEGRKVPDAEIDEEFWEFKELCNATNIRGATQRDIREGRKQARNIAYHINQAYDISRINAGIESAIRFDDKQLVEKITLIFNNGYSETLTREEIENGERFQGF